MRWFVGVGAASSIAALGAVFATVKPGSVGTDTTIRKGDPLVFAVGANKGQPITHTSIIPGQAALAFPKGKEIQDNLTMVIHLNENELEAPTELVWAPEGLVAYSAICTHLGCTVNFSHEAMEGAPYPHIHCPCHAALFKPQAGAEVIGGPAPRPLPQLPLMLNDKAEVLAAGPYQEPIGVL